MRGAILNNPALKGLAVLLAVILWFLVGGQKDANVGFLLSPELRGIPSNMALLTTPPENIEVRLKGPRNFIRKLTPSEVKIEIDMSNAKDGVNSYRIRPYDVKAPRGVTVLEVYPETFDIRTERLVKIVLPVVVNFTGTPAKGFRAASLTPDPQEVEVVARSVKLKKLKRIYTELVDIEGFTATRVFPVALDIPGDYGSAEPERVDVTVIIEKQGGE